VYQLKYTNFARDQNNMYKIIFYLLGGKIQYMDPDLELTITLDALLTFFSGFVFSFCLQ
jgi:hypothetical protein